MRGWIDHAERTSFRLRSGLPETEDVDQQCLLLFLAEAWETIARTGELRDVVPAYLGQPAATNQRCPANAQQ
jgi:hypothetical protein